MIDQDNTEIIRALIIDDLEDNRELLRMDLEDEIENIIVDQASNGFEALEVLKKQEYSIVICDMMMPGMNGATVLEKSREIPLNAEVPFIFLSANKQKEAAETALKAGAIDFLTKPYELIELIYKVRNLARIKHLYSSLEDSKKQLETFNTTLKQLNREKDDVLRIVSHDMRSPLSSIIGFANIIREGDYDSEEDVKNLAAMIEKSGENMLQLINSLLDVARFESGKLNIERRNTSLKSLFTDLLDSFKLLADRKNITFDIQLPEKDVIINVDEPKFKQIISNLISNAIKFTSDKGKVSVTTEIENNSNLIFKVSDTGIGIPENKKNEIFKKFGQYQRTGTANEKGTGLGLSIVKLFIELHGGTITVDSKPKAGTVFTVIINKCVVPQSGK